MDSGVPVPRIPGREPKRRTVPSIEGLEIGSFIMQHEERYWRRKCVIEGCDHRMGPKTDEPGWTDWEPCSRDALPGFVYQTEGLKSIGMVCACHAADILAADAE